jgi:hypothetical protein
MKIDVGQVYLIHHNGQKDPFLVLAPRPRLGENYDVVEKWTVLNLSTMENVYVYDSELSNPDPIEDYYMLEKLF